MSFVERQIDLGGKSRIVKELREIRGLLQKRKQEIDDLQSRIQKLEKKLKVEGQNLEEKTEDLKGDQLFIGLKLLDREEDDDLYNLLLMTDENNGRIYKMTYEKLDILCKKISSMKIGQHLHFNDYEEEGVWCERDEDGDWVMKI